MNVRNVAWALFTVEIVLDYLACRLIMACDTFPEHGDKWIEGNCFRITVDSVDHIGRCHDINFTAQHVESVYLVLAFCTFVIFLSRGY